MIDREGSLLIEQAYTEAQEIGNLVRTPEGELMHDYKAFLESCVPGPRLYPFLEDITVQTYSKSYCIGNSQETPHEWRAEVLTLIG